MLKKSRRVVALLPLLLMAFSPMEDRPSSAEYYYQLRFLKEASPPREMKVIRIQNMKHNRPILEEGVLMTYKNREAKKVFVAGDFSHWRHLAMNRGKHGVWYYFLTDLPENKRLRYKFLVDGSWTSDPKNFDREDDRAGSYVSLINPFRHTEGRHLTYRILKKNRVEFRLYKPEARFVSLVGDFNNWNPENDLLRRGDDGVWRLQKRLPRGTYRYKYIIDGDWHPDYYNSESASDSTGALCSIIKVK